MEDPTETADEDWTLEVPDPPTDLEELRKEVKALTIYVKTMSEVNHKTWKEIVRLRKQLQDLGL
jgi:hypothetical protein